MTNEPLTRRLGTATGVPRVEFVLVVEAGDLEHQARLLCESIRSNTGRYRNAAISAISPVAGRRPSRRFIAFAERHSVDYLERSLLIECPDYRASNRVYAAAERADHSDADVLIVCDSDTLFLREPDFDLVGADVAVRPVDVKGICTSGPDDPFDWYWRALCEIADIGYERVPPVTPTLEQFDVKASYNAGLVVVRRRTGILQKTAELFGRAVRAGLCPRTIGRERVFASTGFVGDIASAYWGSVQAALSLAIWSTTDRVQTLEPTYNVPLHLWGMLTARHPAFEVHGIVHVHYHWLCRAGSDRNNPMLDGRLPLTRELDDWIRARIPFAGDSAAGPSCDRSNSLQIGTEIPAVNH